MNAASALKIAIVRQRYNPYGGAERFVEQALAALAAAGGEITLITRDWQGASGQGFHQIICDPPYSRWLGGRAARDRSFAAAAAQAMTRGAYDITQSHERLPGCMIFRAGDGVHAAWLAHRARILSPAARLAQRLSPYHRQVLAAERAMLTHPALQAVICNSQMVADEVAYYYGLSADRLHVIYNSVDERQFHAGLSAEFRSATRAALHIAEHVPLLLFVGSGFERKGVPQLLNALARQKRSDAQLVLVGADRRLSAMQRLAAALGMTSRVHFIGPQNDVRPYYAAADAFVLPTHYDPCPNAALEALACGLPVLTSTTCGAKELIQPGDNGWVVDALDIEGIAQGMDSLCAWAGNAAVRQAALAAVSGLTPSAMTARLLHLYACLLPKNRPLNQ